MSLYSGIVVGVGYGNRGWLRNDQGDLGLGIGECVRFSRPGSGSLKNGRVIDVCPTRPDCVDGEYSLADINDSDQVVGYTGYGSHPFIWSESTGMVQIYEGRARAEGINNAGWVVGEWSPGGYLSNFHGFLWHPEVGMVDLHPGPEYLKSRAFDINDSGVAIGFARTSTGDRVIRWTISCETGAQGGN